MNHTGGRFEGLGIVLVIVVMILLGWFFVVLWNAPVDAKEVRAVCVKHGGVRSASGGLMRKSVVCNDGYYTIVG